MTEQQNILENFRQINSNWQIVSSNNYSIFDRNIMSRAFFYKTNDRRTFGPFSPQELKEEAVQGRLNPDDTVWIDGTNKIYKAKLIKGLFDSAGPPQSVSAEPPAINVNPAQDTASQAPVINVDPTPQAAPAKPLASNTNPAQDTASQAPVINIDSTSQAVSPAININPTPEAPTMPSQGNNKIESRSHKDQTLAIISLMTGIFSLTMGCCSWWILIPTTLAAFVTGLLVAQKFWRGRGEGKGIYGMALSGIILGIATVVLYITFYLFGLRMADALNQVRPFGE